TSDVSDISWENKKSKPRLKGLLVRHGRSYFFIIIFINASILFGFMPLF
ncbi:MAG: hypothetical protein K0R28_249, partial [Paenibacillus sp.]|nr:hypothetical protein [Paenibacillus sp.]